MNDELIQYWGLNDKLKKKKSPPQGVCVLTGGGKRYKKYIECQEKIFTTIDYTKNFLHRTQKNINHKRKQFDKLSFNKMKSSALCKITASKIKR